MVLDLNIVKTVFNKIIDGEKITGQDIETLIFDKNFKLSDDFITSEDFNQIMEAFNFNGDDRVDIEDFKYLKDHIQDLTVIIKLVRIVTLVISKFCKKKELKISSDDMMDTVIRLVVYCVLFIVVGNCQEFRLWALQSTSLNKNNADILFEILTEIIDYLKSAVEIKNLIGNAINFFKDKSGICKNFCMSSQETDGHEKMHSANIEIRSLKSQLNKEYKLHQISKKINKI